MDVVIVKFKSHYHLVEREDSHRYLTWAGSSAGNNVAPARFTSKSDARIFAECHGHNVVAGKPIGHFEIGDKVQHSEPHPLAHMEGTVIGFYPQIDDFDPVRPHIQWSNGVRTWVRADHLTHVQDRSS